jgi:putative spermidine/putrescine transport system substrate-binding protein
MNVSRRQLIRLSGAAGLAAGLAACSTGNSSSSNGPANSASGAVVYDGKPFDAKGDTLRVGIWGGPFLELVKKYALDAFEKAYNCKVSVDTSFPWFPKFVAGGADQPPLDVSNWNAWELAKTALNGDFFVDADTLRKNLSQGENMWPFAYNSGYGVTYMYTRYGYAYRSDLVPPPKNFKSFWEPVYAGKRATYSTDNGLQVDFFLASSAAWGKGLTDMNAGFDAMKKLVPIKISNFTGNMQSQLTSGEVQIAVLDDGEAFQTADNGVKLDFMYWEEEKFILSQTLAVSKHIPESRLRLAYAFVDQMCRPEFVEGFSSVQYQRPANKLAKLPDALAKRGIANTADQTQGYVSPDWKWFANVEPTISRTVDSIFKS